MTPSAFWWSAAGFFLAALWLIQRWRSGWVWFFVSVLCAAVVGMIPLAGHTPRFWLGGLASNASVPLLVLLAVSVIQRASGLVLFRSREWRTAWIFGAVASLALYPSALGLGLRNFDAYSLGWPWLQWWPSLFLFGAVGWAAGALVWRGNRFGWVLAASAGAYWLRVLESNNFWDYLLDPLFGAVSLVAVVFLALRRAG
jgi:hypothetical protein